MTLTDRLYAISTEIAEAQHATPTEAPHGVRLSVAEHLRTAQREIADALGELAGAADTIPPSDDAPNETAIEQAQEALAERGIIRGFAGDDLVKSIKNPIPRDCR